MEGDFFYFILFWFVLVWFFLKSCRIWSRVDQFEIIGKGSGISSKTGKFLDIPVAIFHDNRSITLNKFHFRVICRVMDCKQFQGWIIMLKRYHSILMYSLNFFRAALFCAVNNYFNYKANVFVVIIIANLVYAVITRLLHICKY